MNEDGKMSISHEPNFSSPNISSSDNLTPVETATPAPQTITDADVSAMAGTDAGAIATAAAAMPENDAPGAIGSGAISSQTPAMAQPTRTHFGLSNRRFNAATPQPAQPVFAGAPDYFNQAAEDIVINNEQASSNKKKIIIAAVVIVAVIVSVVLLLVFASPKGGDITNKIPAEAGAMMRSDAVNVSTLENDYSRILDGNVDVYEILQDGYCEELGDGEKSYSSLKDMMKRYADAKKEDASAKKLKEIYGRMNSEERYSGIGDKCIAAREYVKGEKKIDDVKKYGDAYASAVKTIKEYYDSTEKAEKEYKASICSNEDLDYTPAGCKTIIDAIKQSEANISQTAQLIKNKIFNARTYNNKEKVGNDVLNVVHEMYDEANNAKNN